MVALHVVAGVTEASIDGFPVDVERGLARLGGLGDELDDGADFALGVAMRGTSGALGFELVEKGLGECSPIARRATACVQVFGQTGARVLRH